MLKCDFDDGTPCQRQASQVAITDKGRLLALACDEHAEVLASDPIAGTAQCTWFRNEAIAEEDSCPECGGELRQCKTGDPGCLHCDDCTYFRSPDGREFVDGDSAHAGEG